MTHDAYSPLKIIHHQGRIDELRQGGQPAPAQLHLVISDLCNQNCSFCSYRSEGYSSNQLFSVLKEDGTKNNNPKRMIPFDKVIEILDDCKELGIHAIQLTGGGEPTVHPQYEDILEAVLDRGLDLALVTNGVRLTDRAIGVLMRAAWVRISIDAGEAATYAAIRKVKEDNFFKAWAAVQDLALAKLHTDSKVTVGVSFTITKENWREIVYAAIRAKDTKADNIRFGAIFQNEGSDYFKEFYDEAAALCVTASRIADGRFHVYNNFAGRVGDLVDGPPDYHFCGIQHFCSYIGADLNVYRCCELAYNERGKVGSLVDTSLADLWRGEAKKKNYREFDAAGCVRCPFNSKNRTINYALDKNPRDVNFV